MDYDAIIIGGGPGGSTAGSTLAKAGTTVLILERERFPRFHVGESLIPYGNDVLREIGAWEKMEKSAFMEKLGAEFVLGKFLGTAMVAAVFCALLTVLLAAVLWWREGELMREYPENFARSTWKVWA